MTMRLLLSAGILASGAAAQDAPLGFAATYVCAGGAVLQAAYLNPPGGPSLAVVGWRGRLVPMHAGPTGSGVRYVGLAPDLGLVWHVKGDAGTLFAEAADGAQTTLLADCAATAD